MSEINTYEITLTVTVEKGTYWPNFTQTVVKSDDTDPWKDDQSHLVAYLLHCLSLIHGLGFEGATTKNVPAGGMP